MLDTKSHTRIERRSKRYLTSPQHDLQQPWFVNQVVELSSILEPEKLLHRLQEIEKNLGRIKDPKRRYGPRNIDLDILLYGNTVMRTKQLTLPHPRIFTRAFVLIPLAELAPDLIFPDGRAMNEVLSGLNFKQEDNLIYQ